MVEFDELDEDDVRNQIVTISNELRAVRDRSTLVLEGATRILLDLIRKVEPFNEEPLSETVDEGRKRPNRVSWTSWVCDRSSARRW